MSNWPIIEAKKILKHLKKRNFDFTKDTCNFEMGYAPSGDIHLGTLMEAIRSNMVMKALQYLTNNKCKTKLICFSDDMDALRKEINHLIPNSAQYLGTPISSIPSSDNETFAEKMNNKLVYFLNKYNVDFSLYSATDFYKSGKFNAGIKSVMQNYDKIMKIMLPTLGDERKKTYSPILPISKKTGKVLLVPIKVNLEDETITYTDYEGEKFTHSPYHGQSKLQWKIDFAMRWKEIPVHFEMYGKEHNDSAIIYNKICHILEGRPPHQFVYEMLLNIDGSKLSKSKDNQSITIEEWLHFAPFESLILFMYQHPQRAKILHSSIIPKYVDDYLLLNDQYHKLRTEEEKVKSPIWHIHHDKEVPKVHAPISFNMLINLACSLNIHREDVLLKFIDKHLKKQTYSQFFLSLLKFAIRYSEKMIEKKFKTPDEMDIKILLQLKEDLQDTSLDSQKILYNLARKFEISDTKSFFSNLYQILIGRESGPRLGTFIDLLGRDDFITLLNSKIIKL